jgi:prepilin-type N-terminal cleavage/methylation domain-containing protein
MIAAAMQPSRTGPSKRHNAPMKSPKSSRKRFTGFTLLELVAVLAVLAVTAAIIIPLFPNLLRRANKATDATQMNELYKSLQTYNSLYFTYPSDMDTLTDSTGAMPAYLPGTTTGGAYDGLIVPTTLSDHAAGALNKVGITRLQPLATTVSTGNATQAPYPSLDPATDGIAVATGVHVAVLDSAAILAGTKEVNSDLYNIIASDQGDGADHPGTYVVFGIGSRNTAVGRTMADAPVAMPQNGEMSPAKNYCRYGAIFKVDGNEIALTKRARLVSVVTLEEDEIETIENEVIGFTKVIEGEAAQH